MKKRFVVPVLQDAGRLDELTRGGLCVVTCNP